MGNRMVTTVVSQHSQPTLLKAVPPEGLYFVSSAIVIFHFNTSTILQITAVCLPTSFALLINLVFQNYIRAGPAIVGG